MVDAFCGGAGAYSGNPTCVVFPPRAVSAAWMAAVARASAQPTTSFVDLREGAFRTFGANGVELPLLSGHSSVGVAAAALRRAGGDAARLRLASRYGTVELRRDGDMYEVALPAGSGGACEPTARAPLAAALGVDGAADVLACGRVLGGRFLFAELTPAAFARLAPDRTALRALPDVLGVFATAAGMAAPHAACAHPETVDFSVRHFAPGLGIEEDVATGSIQAFLHPYWAAKRAADGACARALLAWQHSARGGLIRSQPSADGGHVLVAGRCALSLRGTAPLQE